MIISIFAGVGEELFFRGIIQNEFGLAAASVLFALLHFGKAAKENVLIVILYCLIGVYLGVIYQRFGTLAVPVLTHVIYDYFALLYLHYLYKSQGQASAVLKK